MCVLDVWGQKLHIWSSQFAWNVVRKLARNFASPEIARISQFQSTYGFVCHLITAVNIHLQLDGIDQKRLENFDDIVICGMQPNVKQPIIQKYQKHSLTHVSYPNLQILSKFRPNRHQLAFFVRTATREHNLQSTGRSKGNGKQCTMSN